MTGRLNMKWTFFVLFCVCLIIRDGYTKGGGGGRGGGGRSGSSGRSGGSGRSGSGSKGGGGGGSKSGSKSGSGSRSSSWGGHKSISRSSTKSLAAGLAGGYVGYKGAKLARKVSSGSSYMYYPSYHRTYYYGSRYYSQSASNYGTDQEMCTYQIESNDEYFNLTYENDGTRVTEIIYHCSSGEECCEGLECCNRGIPWILVVAGIIMVAGAIYVFAYRCQKMVDDTDTSHNDEGTKDNYLLNSSQQVTAYTNVQVQTFVPQHQQQPSSDFVPTYMQLGLQKPDAVDVQPAVTFAQPPPPYGLNKPY